MAPIRVQFPHRRVRYWSSDESRVGLLSVQGRKLTGFGIKPVGLSQWEFRYRWLYGLVEPRSGEAFVLEFSHLDSHCFERFLEQFALQYPEELHVIQVDNAGAHCAHHLQIPDNVLLLHQPPYCPEVNAIERLWEEVRRDFAWRRWEDLAELQESISRWVKDLSRERVKSLTGWDWLLEGLAIAGI